MPGHVPIVYLIIELIGLFLITLVVIKLRHRGRAHWRAAKQPMLDQVAEGEESYPASHIDHDNNQWCSIVLMSKKRAGWYKQTRKGFTVLLSQEGDSNKYKSQAQTEQQALAMINEWLNHGTLPESY